jgi:outer membrane immunogenic protein
MITRTIASIAVAAATLTAAHAADFSVMQPQPIAYSAPAFSWTGLYAGLHAGYGWGTVDTDIPGAPNYNIDGFNGGIHAGYNHDLGGFVLGIEGDLNLSDIVYSEVFMAATTSLRVENFGSIRARAGFAADRFMPYITGGFAFGTGSFSVDAFGGSFTERQTHTGWTIGAGAEYAVTDNILLRAEYLYTDLGEKNYLSGVLPPGVNGKVNFGTARVGASFKF